MDVGTEVDLIHIQVQPTRRQIAMMYTFAVFPVVCNHYESRQM